MAQYIRNEPSGTTVKPRSAAARRRFVIAWGGTLGRARKKSLCETKKRRALRPFIKPTIMSELRLRIRGAHVKLRGINLLIEAELRQLEYKILQDTLAQTLN